MTDIFTRSRNAFSAADDFPAAVGSRFAYPVCRRPANDVGRTSPRRQRAALTSAEINQRLLALLCTCATAAAAALWIVSNLRG